MHRRTATKVVDGRVRKKNNHAADPGDYFVRRQDEIRLDRRRPAHGHRHLVTVADLRAFLPLLPDWDRAAGGLDAIVLDDADDCMGWCDDGVVAIAGWESDLWWENAATAFVTEHRHVFDRIGVEYERKAKDRWQVRWTERQAHAFQLLHILPHEMGHHHDRLERTDGGEPFAEAYANRVLDEVWDAYCALFGAP